MIYTHLHKKFKVRCGVPEYIYNDLNAFSCGSSVDRLNFNLLNTVLAVPLYSAWKLQEENC